MQILSGIFGRHIRTIRNDALEELADDIVEKTIAAKNKSENTKKPFVLILGEEHNSIRHHIVQMLVIEKLHDKGFKLSIGIEHAHDTLKKSVVSAKSGLKHVYSDTLNTSDYIASLKLLAAHIPFYRLGEIVKFKTIIDNKLPVVFNDAAIIRKTEHDQEHVYLDNNDAQVLKEAKQITPYLDPIKINVLSKVGMYIRNIIMAKNAMRHMDEQKPDIFIQLTGAKHAFGGENLPPEESLSQEFKKHGYNILIAPLLFTRTPKNEFSKSELLTYYLEPDQVQAENDEDYSIDFTGDLLKAMGRDSNFGWLMLKRAQWNAEMQAHLKTMRDEKRLELA